MQNDRPVLQLTLGGELVKEYPSLKQAAKQFGGPSKALQRLHYAVRGRKNIKENSDTAYNFKWRYKD